MPRIYTCGESLLDLIFDGSGQAFARPGGSVLNTSVSLGRLGAEVSILTEYGTDPAGEMIGHFLEANQVNTSGVCRYGEGQTALALAMLDEKRNARYSFYKNYPARRLLVPDPPFSSDDIFLFGSLYSISGAVSEKVCSLAREARDKGALVVYDPNFRTSHLPGLKEYLPRINRSISLAHVIRGSDEDFVNIFGTRTGKECYLKHIGSEKILVYTRGENGSELFLPGAERRFAASSVRVVSTIGAGDSFNAGILFAIYSRRNGGMETLMTDIPFWMKAIHFATECAADVCMSLDNYLSSSFAESRKSECF